MSKQTSRQTSKQGQSTNKQSKNQISKQTSPANKQVAGGSVKKSNSANKPLTRQAMKQERRQEEQQRRLDTQRRNTRNKRILIGSIIAAAVLLVVTVSYLVYSNAHNASAQNQATPAGQVFNPAYQPVDGIYCDQLEKTFYHIHAHLTIYINGKQVTVPQGVGIAPDQSCFYWLHTHANNGVIHIEFPKQGSPTLGNFLDVWEKSFQQLGFHNELASTANWMVYVDGKQVNSDFNHLVLQSHQVITIAYSSPGITPDTIYNWQPGE
jgi:hypothetical protein